jgi:uncharacterized protein YchJ
MNDMHQVAEPSFEGGSDLDSLLSPLTEAWSADHILGSLQGLERPSVEALEAGLLKTDEIAPAICDCMVRAAAGESLSQAESTLVFRGVFVLGGARHQAAFAPLLALLRSPSVDLDDLFGDMITEALKRIAVGLYDDRPEPFFDAILDSKTDCYVVSALLDAAAYLTWSGRIARQATEALLVKLDTEWPRDHDPIAWLSWSEVVELLAMDSLVPAVERAYRDGRIPREFSDLGHFRKAFAEAAAKPASGVRFARRAVGLVKDVLDELSRFTNVPESSDAGSGFGAEDWPALDASEPVRNPLRNVGRNDPCPCGSGRKFKKCCLDK